MDSKTFQICFILTEIFLAGVLSEYKGCFTENKRRRHMNVNPGDFDPNNLTPNICAAKCGILNYQFAGLTGGNFCFCSNQLPPLGDIVSDTECSSPCTGNTGEKCGSLDHTSVYLSSQPVVGLAVTKTPTTPIKVDDSVTFDISITSGIGAYYQFTYDDDAGKTPKNDSDMYQYTFHVPGEYSVTVHASDFNDTIPEARAVTTVVVEEEVGPVFLECEELCATHEYCSCIVKVYKGTKMSLIDTVQGTANPTFTITDPIYDTVGFAIPTKGSVADNTHGSGTYILEHSEFRMEGKVLGLNIWAKTVGSITVVILKPDCGVQTYCSESNTCQASCLGYETQDCAAGSFCPTSKTCSASCTAAPRVNTAGTIDMNYIIKQRVDVELKVDFNYYSMTDDIYVSPGDKLGFIQSGAGVVSKSSSTNAGEFDYFFSGKSTGPYQISDTQVNDPNRFLLSAVMSSPSLVYLHYEFTSAGMYGVTTDVSNTHNQQTNSTNVEVIEGINSTEIIAPMYVEANVNVDFNLAPHSGSNVIYTYNFGMGEVNTTSLPFSYTFTYAGVFNVTCEAFNQLSQKSNFTQVTVEYRLVGLAVTSNPTATNTVTDFSFVLTSGSNFTCEWNYGDGSAVEAKTDVDTPSGGATTTVQHTYTVAGTYNVNVTCFNNINKENVLLQQVVEDPVMNLAVNPAGADKNVPFTIRWTVSQGTSPVVQMHFNSVDFVEGATTNGFTSVSTAPVQTWESTQVPGLPVGIYDLRLTVKNSVSEESQNITFKVEAAMKDVVVTVSKTTVPTLEAITFTIDMTEGSSVNYIIDYDDGSMENKSIGDGIDWPGTKTYSHSYTVGKVYNASVVVWNAPGTKNYFFSILAVQSVNAVVMHNEVYYRFTPPAYPHFNFSASGTAPNAAEVFFDFGDGQDETRELVLYTNYDHEFRETGPYTVTANVSNSVSSKTFTTQITVVEVLETLTLATNPAHAAVNSAISLDVILYRAPTGPDCLINVDYGHPSIPKLINHQRTGQGMNGKDTLPPVTYSVPLGTYVITVDVVTPLETLRENHTIQVQDPVKPGFTVTFNPPTSDKLTHPGPAKFVINYPMTPMPTDSTYEIDFGNGVEIQGSFNTLMGTVPGSIQLPDHVMATDGTFTAKLTIHNLASSQTSLFTVGSYKPITGTTIATSYKPLLPRNGPALVGMDNVNGSFPRDRPVIFTISHPDGTIESYDIFYTDGTTVYTANRTSSPFEIDFPGSGTFNVTVTAKNPLYSSSGLTVVRILDRVVGVNITDLVPAVGSGVTKKFGIGFEIQGDNTCLVVDFGDGVTRSWADNSAHCNPFVTADKYQGALTGTTEIEHIYNKNGFFDIVVTGSNSFSSSSMTINVPVSTAVCKHPKVGIRDQSFQFDNPMTAKKGSDSRIVGESDIYCSTTLNNQKSWKIEEVDYNTGNVIREIDISTLETRQNAELYIPARFLDYGLYRATYSMEMLSDSFDGGRYVASSYTLYKVVKSDLVGIIEKGGISEIVRGQSSTIVLNPQMYSFDPDDSAPVGSQAFTSFTWNCTPANENATNAHCDNLIPPSTSGSPINVDLTSGLTNADYKFCVVISKDTRQSTACLIVQLVDGTPPAVYLECSASSVCTQQADGQLIPPSGRLGVNCECTGCTGTLEYEWTFFVYDYRWPWKDIRNLTKYVNDINSKELAITTNLFKDNPEVTRFRASCSARNVGQTNSGSAYMNFFINAGPSNGKCNVSKTEGTVSVNSEFCIYCEGWQDAQGIADYQIIARMKDDDVYREIITVFNFDEPVCIDLPMGAEYDNFYEYLYVNIRDKLGAVTEDFVSRVRVTPLSPEESQALIQNFINSDFDNMDKTFAEADINKVTALTSNLVAILNSDSKKAQSEYSGVGVASSKTNTGFGPSDANRTGAYIESESVSNPAANQKYEEEKDLRSKLKQQAVMALSSVTTSNVISIKQISSSLAEMLHYPEEVTLKSASAAINKTLDMAKHLSNMTDVTYENRKFAFVYMAATIGGAMDAIGFNGDNPSLTELAESKSLPEFKVYDTNWENTEGAIQADNLDAAINQHQKHTHKNHAGEESSGFIEMATEAMTLLTQGFSENSVPGEKIEFVTNRMQGVVTNQDAKSVLGNTVGIPNSKVELSVPDDINAIFPGGGKTENDSFVLSLMQSSSVPYQYSPNSDDVASDSNGLVIEIYDENGNIQVIKNLVKPIEFTIPRDKNAPVPKYKEADPLIVPWDRFYYHKMNLTKKGSSIHVQFDITDPNAKFLVVVKLGELPDITAQKCDFVGVIPDESMPAQYRYTYFLDNRKVDDFIGSVYIGVRQIDDAVELYQNYNTCSDIPQYEPGSGKPKKYNFRVFSTGCYFYNKTLNDWSSEGCWVGHKTDESLTHCYCTHLTTFAGGWVVVPNTIDWNFIFSNADFAKNPTLYITEIVIAVVYILAIIWARREDKKDIEKIGVTPLKDNDVRDKYYYEVVVVTGMRRNAGTDSKVFFILSGEFDETDVRMFSDDKRKVFRRGSVDAFLVAVPRPLGNLNYARVWHDNSGKGKTASWYLKYLLVRDIQTNQRSVFICNKWFAVEEDDGQVDRVIPVAGKEQMTEFGHLFTERSRKSLVDGHLWFSVVARPAQSRFTRVQRVSCCLLLLFVSMLGNALFYGTATNSTTAVNLGPFALSPEQIFIGIAVNLIVFPINFLVMTLFRKSRARKMRPSRIAEALKKGGLSPATTEGDMKGDLGGVWMSRSPTVMGDPKRSGTSASMRPETSFSSVSRMGDRNYESIRIEKKKKKKKFEFPWWCTILGWILLWLGVGVSVAFVTFYGITFQDEKCKKWITSMLMSFFTSVFITQPVKVFLTAIFFSLVVKNPGEEEEDEVEDEESHNLAEDEEYMHFDEGYGATRPRRIGYKPPDPAELERARIQRLNEIKMWEIIREIVFYAFFLWILMVISYRNRSPDAFFYKNSLVKTFIDNNDTKQWFSKIKNTEEFWNWAESGLVNGIRASNYYNSDPPLLLRGFVNDKVSRIMGYATMRQLRVQPGLCETRGVMSKVIKECNEPYSLTNEDEESYMPGWQRLNSSQTVNDTSLEWKFTEASVLNGYPYWGILELYGGGGYVVQLRGSKENLQDKFKLLESQGWIDRYTRGIFVEFTIYNPQVNLFAVATILAEFDRSGGVTTSYRFEPAMLLPYMSSVMLFQIACEVIYLLFTAWFIFKAAKKLFKERLQYFTAFWNIIEMGIIAVSLGAVIVYFYRLIVTNELTAIFARSHGNEYMKFQYAGYWNEIFTYMIGWLVFFGTLKFLKLLRFNKRMALVAATLKNGSNSLIHFGIIFLIVYMAFMQLFYLTFMNLSTTFSTFITSMESGILMMMGKFDIYSMLMVEPFLTQLFVFGFVVTITFILVNMFLSILNETFGAVREDMNKVNNDYEIVDFMVGRFKRWTGIGSPATNTLQPSDMMTDSNGKPISGSLDNVNHFPDRIDRLLNSISNIYMDENGIAQRMNQKQATYDKSNMKSMLRGHGSKQEMTEIQN